jgi:hypothetical protein
MWPENLRQQQKSKNPLITGRRTNPIKKAKTASMKKERKSREGVRLGISGPTLENPEGRKGSSHYPLIDEKSL